MSVIITEFRLIILFLLTSVNFTFNYLLIWIDYLLWYHLSSIWIELIIELILIIPSHHHQWVLLLLLARYVLYLWELNIKLLLLLWILI